jgi:hypothetical protein
MANPPGSKFQTLQELQRRQQALLAGMEGQAMYPDMGGEPQQYDHDGIVETSDALPSNVGDFSQARESPEKQRRMAELDQAAARSTVAPKADDYRPVTSNEYEYKPEFQGSPGTLPGRHAGPMAQDLEHIPGIVEQGHDGMKRVRTDRLPLSNASAIGELSRSDESKAKEIESLKRRLAALEGGISGSPDDALKSAQSGRY